MTPDEMTAELFRLSRELDKALRYYGNRSKEYAQAEHDYRKAKGQAWVTVRVQIERGTVPEREAWVDAETADLRRARDLADGMRQAGLEAIRSRRAQLSALQSALGAVREEMAFARTGAAA